MSIGKSLVAPVAAALVTGANSNDGVGVASSSSCRSELVEHIVPKPGTGPSEHADNGHYKVETYTTTTEVSGTAPPWPSRATQLQGDGGAAGRERDSRWHWTMTRCRICVAC